MKSILLTLAASLLLMSQAVHGQDLAPPLKLTQEGSSRDARTGRLLLPGPEPAETALPIVGRESKLPAASYLQRLNAQGKAAGLDGVVYDNRDRGHVALPRKRFPQLSHSRYNETLRKQSVDYGLANRALIDAITFGNASVAMTAGARWRSMSRAAMTSQTGAAHAWLNYMSNHIYVYPEHRDHDDVDHFPANWPYNLTSQGSSFSVRPFLDTLAVILASFTPETRKALQDNNLVAPTVQMVFRAGQKMVRSRETYLSGIAHPVVFNSENIAQSRMAALAQSLTPETIPPRVDLQIERESFQPRAGLAELSEKMFTTSSAIARIWRSWAWQQEMVVSAAATKDPNGQPLTFTWVLLRGDPKWAEIVPLDIDGARARIRLSWPVWQGKPPHGQPPGNRIDIGVFANNGSHDSAPAMISVTFPPHQDRVYEPAPGGGKRLAQLNYRVESYVDPVLFWAAPWRDEMRYSADGAFDGWTRHFPAKPDKSPLEIGRDGQPLTPPALHYEQYQSEHGMTRLRMRRD